MVSLKLPLAAALLSFAAVAPAATQVVHHHTVVTHSYTRTPPGRVHHVNETHKVCHNYWSNHRQMHRCRTVHWNS